jgi:NADH:ubiquinone oxidoreductase subunit K
VLPSEHILYLGAVLFSAGLVIVIIKRNAIMVLLGLELMLNAANLNLVYFNSRNAFSYDGQMFALFVMVVAVCEAAVGLAIVLKVYQFYKTSNPDEAKELKG